MSADSFVSGIAALVQDSGKSDAQLVQFAAVIAGVFIVVVVLIALYVRYVSRNYKNMLARRSAGRARDFTNSPYSRTLPFDDSLPATFSALYLVRDLPKNGTIVGTLLLEWIRLGKAMLQNGPAGVCIRFYETVPELSPQERELYGFFLQASGDDHVLAPDEFARWSARHTGLIKQWLATYDELGLYLLHEAKAVETRVAYRSGVDARVAEQSAKPLPPPVAPGQKAALDEQQSAAGAEIPAWLADMNTNVYFTQAGRAALAQAYGFKKYLKDFTILEERLPQEVQLWQRYLVYAQLFGIAGAVSQSFAKTYPASFSSDASFLFLQAILSGLTDAVDKAWFEILTAGAKDDALGTRK